MDLGPYASFVIAAYAIVAVGIALFVAWLFVDGRRQQGLIDELEARGVRRRSMPPTGGA
jgi:heme exporter protein D